MRRPGFQLKRRGEAAPTRGYRVIERGEIVSRRQGSAGNPFSTSPRTFSVTLSTTAPLEILGKNDRRKKLLIQNVSANDCYLAFGRAASTDDHVIAAGGSYESEGAVENSAVSLLGTIAGQAVVITEGS